MNLSRRCVPAVDVDLSSLDDNGFVVIEDLRYYPYRATFDSECYFSDERLPADSERQTAMVGTSRTVECERGFECTGT